LECTGAGPFATRARKSLFSRGGRKGGRIESKKSQKILMRKEKFGLPKKPEKGKCPLHARQGRGGRGGSSIDGTSGCITSGEALSYH